MIKDKKSIPDYEPGTIIVKLRNDDTGLLKKYKEHKHVHTKAMQHFNDRGYHKVKVDDVEAAVKELKNHPNVEWVSRNYSRSTQVIDDPYWKDGSLWGLKAIGADLAWASGNMGDQSVYVGVIDEGIQFFHEDLCGQVWTNPDEIDGDGVDNDGNGYVDDMHGWDFHNHNNTIYDGPGDNHGTHVSGTIGAKASSVGVIGVCPNVTLVSGKFLEDWGYDDDAIQAIDYMIWLKVNKGLDIVALSNSWGGGGYNPGLRDAIERAKLANILFVAAAGNSSQNSDINPMYPAAYDNENIISVAAIQGDGTLAWFSNYGLTTVDLGAPGVGIWSTVPGAASESGYGSYSGTSMATPHVSGACALYRSAHKNAGWQEIKNAILSNVSPNPNLAGKCVTGGHLNVSSFAGTSPTPAQRGCVQPPLDTTKPTPPQNFHVSSIGINSVSFEWEAATDDQSGIKEYWIFINDTNWGYQFIGDQWRSGTVTGLTAGVEYSFFAYAVDGWNNWSDPTPIVKAIPLPDAQAPTTPGNVSAQALDQDTILVTWSQSTDDAGIDHYNIYFKKSVDFAWQKEQQGYYSFFWEINNLLPGTDYDIYVTATDVNGNESAPSPIVNAKTAGDGTPPDTVPPTIPAGLDVTDITETSLTLFWNASSDNIGVAGYNIFWKKTSDSNYARIISQQTTYAFSGLQPGTLYDFYVSAFDDAGNTSDASLPITRKTVDPPPPVGDITVVLSGVNKLLSWVITNANNPLVELQRKNKEHQQYTTIMSGSANFTSYQIPPKPPKVYWWRVRVSEGGQVVYSNEIQL